MVSKNTDIDNTPLPWSYTGETRPEKWKDIDPQNKMCSEGKEQSPINIEVSQIKVDSKLSELKINYTPTTFTLMNNGHTIKVTPTNSQNSIVLEGVEYKLSQLHFHTPSEHQFNGENFDMELHLVHKDINGNLTVLEMMIEEGQENMDLSKIWGQLPQEKTAQDVLLQEAIDLSQLIPKDQKTFRYMGSLTTPPCTENVKWVIFEQSIELSKQQIQKFRSIFPDINRPVQDLNGRAIYGH